MIKKVILLSTLLFSVSAMDLYASATSDCAFSSNAYFYSDKVTGKEMLALVPLKIMNLADEYVKGLLNLSGFNEDGHLSQNAYLMLPDIKGNLVVFTRDSFEEYGDVIGFVPDSEEQDYSFFIIQDIDVKTPKARKKRFKSKCHEWMVSFLMNRWLERQELEQMPGMDGIVFDEPLGS